MSLLQNKIIEASQKYYQSGTSDISDEQFDQLLDQLKEENPDDPLLNQVGHGYDMNQVAAEKSEHIYGLVGSLAKCRNYAEFSKGLDLQHMTAQEVIYASLKLDGLSAVLYYEGGFLTKAITRGDGTLGIDITAKVIKINPEVQTMSHQFTGAIRGEILMSFSNFAEYKIIRPDAKNPRNSAAGIINSKELSPDLKYLDIVFYNVIACTSMMKDELRSWKVAIDWIEANGFEVVPYAEYTCTGNHFEEAMQSYQDKWYNYYPADGIVLTANTASVTDESRYVFNAIAFKFKAETTATTVTNVEWNLGKSKCLIPRVQFETVSLSGTLVSWAHGDNAQNIRDSRLGPGAEIEVTKRNEIIPHIERVISGADVELPTKCPACGADLIWQGMHLMCPNPDCGDIEAKDLLIWTDIIAPTDGLGDTLKLKFFADILGQDNISIESVYQHGPLLGETSSKQFNLFCDMYNRLFDVRKISLQDAIRALNIPRLSDVNSSRLANYPEIVLELQDEGAHRFAESEIKEIGPANCESIIQNSKKFKRLNFIKDAIDYSVKPKAEVKGKVAITGKLSVKRDFFENELKEHGYVPASSVNKDTFCLITDDPSSATSKNKAADKYNIPKLSESEFRSTYLN